MRVAIFVIIFLKLASIVFAQNIHRVPDDFDSIQTAIDFANTSDTILISRGVYQENLNVTKPLSIIGDSIGQTIIRHDTIGSITIKISNKNVVIKNLHFNKSAYQSAIQIKDSENCRIENCIIDSIKGLIGWFGTRGNDALGIHVLSSKNIFISNSTIKDIQGGSTIGNFASVSPHSGIGVLIEESSEVQINNCKIENICEGDGDSYLGGSGSAGVVISQSDNNILINGCAITNNYSGVLVQFFGQVLIGGSPNKSNFISDNQLYNLWNQTSNLIQATYNNWGIDNFESISKTIRGEVNFGDFITTIKRTYLPSEFKLYQNYPNPFNPETTITFDLLKNEHVDLTVYSILGEKIVMLIDGVMQKGSHQLRFDASWLTSGTYLYTLKTQSAKKTKKMVLVR